MRSYDCDISNRWINNTEKTIENDEKKKKRTTDMWLLITLWVLCCTVAAAAAFFLHFIEVFCSLCSTEPAEVYQDKRCTTFFRITSQARSVPFFSPLSLSLSHISTASPCECVNVLIFLSSSFSVVLCAVAADASLERSLFCLLLCFVFFTKGF